ncbi:tRNA (cytidine(32)-2'-O)-methyltransferase non-catalytic subunit Trm732p [[Candida] railenensis]|uniref:tRNA (Cytidine(32)-2'-O)-methyltransferase non-catalytic subunit Trm732p n=1 Tax=[Candida] railenensis TaxID=45579 RepID=A0A9P0VY06_9ASCO|nr:tRNA (cytidine(32)-2'-O)-methyltransferase non-catalytic subunit Trm732p [[Candida] railenensis]
MAQLGSEELLVLKKKLIKSNVGSFFHDVSSGELQSFQCVYATLLDVKVNESGDKTKVLCCDVLSIWLLRYTQCVRKKSSLEKLLARSDINSLFQYIVDFLEQSSGPSSNALNVLLLKSIDTVIVTFASEKDEIFQKWIDTVMNLSITTRSKYQLIEVLGKSTNPKYILDKYPTFANNCISIMWSDALANSASKSFATIYRGIYEPTEHATWIQLWQSSVMEGLRNLKSRKNIQTYLLPLLFTISQESFSSFMNLSFKTSKASIDTDIDLLIGVAKVGQDLAIVTEPFDPQDKDSVIPLPILIDIMTHQSPKYRLASFALFLGSPKSSVPIPQYILDTLVDKNIIETFFMDYDDTDIRNDFVSSMKQFLMRILDSSYSANRDLTKLQKKNVESDRQDSLKKYLLSAKRFLQWLVKFLLKNLAPASNYAQLFLGFHITEYLITLGLDNSVVLTPHDATGVTKSKKSNSGIKFPYSIEIFSDSLIRILMDNITNNYEDLREKSVSLLLMCPKEKIAEVLIGNSNQSERIISVSIEILSDLKGRKSEGGARVLQFLTQAYQRLEFNTKIIDLFDLLYNRIDSVLDKSAVLSPSFETVAPQDRLHGVFTALRLMLSSLEPEMFPVNHSFYERLFSKFIGEYYPKIWTFVKPVLGNTTGDLSEVEEKLTLNYSWKLVKESTSYLKFILDISSKHPRLIKKEEFLSIVDITIDQLSSVNHRGAFSSVYPTFIACCECCLQSSDSDLQRKPFEWLKSNILLLESKTQLISRRSGGLPYLITGILTAGKNSRNYNVIEQEETLLSFSMKELIRIASIPYVPNADEKMDISQVHAFNSMKHIFIDSQLSDDSVFFVKDALRIALVNCNSKTWAIRNCAVMLFTALQNRLFGTKKLGGIIPTVSAKSFFNKYDGIENILLSNLDNSLSGDSNVESVFPIITILMRLESNNDTEESSLKRFETLLHGYLSHKSWKIREVAARALAAVVQPIEIENFLIKLLEEFHANVSFNKRHGILLTILEIIKRINLKLPDIETLHLCLEHLIIRAHSFIHYGQTFDWAINKVYIDILLHIHDLELPSSAVQYLSTFIIKNYLSSDAMIGGSEQLFLQETINLLLSQHLHKSQIKECIELINICILSKEAYEVQLVGISFCKKHYSVLRQSGTFDREWTQLNDDIWSMIIRSDNSWSLVKSAALSLSQKLLSSSKHYIMKSDEELSSMVALLKEFTVCGDFSEDVNSMALEVLGPLSAELLKRNKEFAVSNINDFFLLVSIYADDDKPFDNRYSAINAVSAFVESFTNELTDKVYTSYMCKAIFSLYFALSDDDREIRDLASSTLSRLFDFKFESGNLAVSKYIVENVLNLFNVSDVESDLVPLLCDEKKSISATISLIQKQESDANSLFDIEAVNLYRNELQLHSEIVSIVRQLPLSPESVIRMKSAMRRDFEVVNEFINTKGSDGYIGWTRSEFAYTAMYKLISNLNLLKELDLTESEEVNKFELKLEQRNIHPLLKDMLTCK